MAVKRKDKENDNEVPGKNKRIRQEKVGDFSDDENLSDMDEASEIFNGIRIPSEMPPIMSAEENSGPRMIITNIVANNFKSYYGEVNIGPFHKSLTSIVGANGSGKSNVIDSLLFVFGYRSTKIRSKKVSVLLHKSDKHKDVSQCSVTVNFVHINDDKTQESGFNIIPGTEIKITRTAFKDNTSFYTLNNKRVKFKEIATILKKNGIDLVHNRFLILQGEVEQIAMMKPKAENEHSTGMLEYLEDVIGTVRYKKPILRLEEKIKDLSLEKNEKVTRMKFVGKEREELIEPAEATIRVLKLQNKIAHLHNKDYQRSIHKVNKLIKIEVEKKKNIEDKLDSMENELKEIAESKKNKDEILRSLNEELKENEKKLEDLHLEFKNVLLSDTEIRGEIKQIKEQIQKYENSIERENNKITKAKGVPLIKEAELKQLQSELEPLMKECIKLEENYTKVNSSGFEKSKKFREEKELLAPEELKLQKIVGSKQNQFQTLKTEFEVLLDTEKSEKEKLSRLEEQLTKGDDDFQENMKKKKKAEDDLCVNRNIIKDLEKNIDKLKNDEEQMKIKLQNIRQSLIEKRTAYAETTERSRPIQYILNLKDKGDISGVLGRCGDYGLVEEKIDIPASTACGSTDQIVVETSDAAHACIQKLRTNNIGRLTFSILPQVQKYKSQADKNNNYPENAKRVFDFIQILDQRFRLTFYSGLFDTLIANDLEQARRLAFGPQGRYRVVTYKGDLIDQSGIMSGGGKPIKGKIGPQETKSRYAGGNTSQVSQNEVEKLDKIAKNLEIELRETQSKIFDFQTNIEQHARQIEELNSIIKQCSLRINMWKEKKIQVKNLIEAQKLVIVQKKADPVAVANKEAEIVKAEKELNEANIMYNKIKSEVDNLKTKIEQITEGEPKEAKRLLDEANNKLEKTRSGINQVNIDINAAKRQIKKSESQIKNLTDDINEFNERSKILHTTLEISEKSHGGMSSTLLNYEKMVKEQKKNIEEIKNKDDETIHRSNKLRKDKIELSQEYDEIKGKIRRLEDKVDLKKDKMSKLMLHKIPKIDNIQCDPIMESYQNYESNNQDLGKKNENENNEKNNPNKMQVDDDDIDEENKGEIDINQTNFIKYSPEQLENLNVEVIKEEIVILNNNLNGEKPNFNILEEFQKRTQQFNEKAIEVAKVLKTYNDHVTMINKVRQRRRDEFMASFRKITIKLKEMYQMITLGGDAELELVDSLDPFSEGVNFSVRPPKKTWKVISNLSGGEKTLSSLALVFALHYYKPSPLYVMDEIDAALDFKNVSIIAYYIKERTKNSQFIIISLRSNMFEKANLLVGIYKTNDCTATTSVSTDYYDKLLAGQLKETNLVEQVKS